MPELGKIFCDLWIGHCGKVDGFKLVVVVREAAKKSSSLNGLTPLPPSGLMAIEILERWKKKFQKKFFFT